MIIYFADRRLKIIGQASTHLPNGLTIVDDLKTEDVETGVSSFECKIPFSAETRQVAEDCAKCGNYILRSNGDEKEFYTVIEAETDVKKQEVYIYAEDAGLDLLNEIVEPYEATEAKPVAHYINKFIYDTGFIIGINEIPDLSRKLKWDGESTAAERVASVATQFDAEISYSFEIKGLSVTKKLVNIYKKRGKDIGENLRLNFETDNIITKSSIAELATALLPTGGTPEGEENPINLSGYTYDDGDIYLEGKYLKSRKAVEKWSRYLNPNEPNTNYTGHILRMYNYDTTEQATLCAHAVTALKKACQMEVNYEIDITKLPKGIKIGDRVNIIDDAGGLYISTRLLKLETSVVDNTQKATLGEYLIKGSGISQKVVELAAQFAKMSQSSAHALNVANNANNTATEAQNKADQAATDAANAQQAAADAEAAANTANQSAKAAQEAASNAQAAVDVVEENVALLETTVNNADAAAKQAKEAAATAETKATEAKTAATNAETKATEAITAAGNAETKAAAAETAAATAKTTAEQAIADAEAAETTANAAKLDAEQAKKDVDALGDSLRTLSNTMSADYARKTDLTETEASLQTQISQNAAQIQSTATKVTEIDETANNAAEQAAQAQKTAAAAQTEADNAKANATAAQTSANEAKAAATAAQTEADNAKSAATAAKSVADKAETDLATAKADLATIQGRVDATEEEIAAAQAKVDTAQAAADKAKEDAAAATNAAANAQTTANTAVTNAETAQKAADDAAAAALIAQQTADTAKGDAAAAQTKANEAATAAATAQQTADTAKANAATAQNAADQAATDAANAQAAAKAADDKAKQAAADLITAQNNLADVTSRVDSTEEDIAAAEAAVATAQTKADEAATAAATAQTKANEAATAAATAQSKADTAATEAAAAQTAADEAKTAADAAQNAVDELAVRVTKAETNITQNAELIELKASKDEVTETLGGYYTKTETDAVIGVASDEVNIRINAVTTAVDDQGATLEELSTNVNKNFSFTAEGLIIGSANDGKALRLDNGEVVITENGEPVSEWIGRDFHCGNIVVDVDSRAQFGNFAFIPRSDGSLSLLKVN